MLTAQRLFRELGYPLGGDRPGQLGVGTRGALEYFQRKYGLPVSGLPDPETLTLMAAVEASLHGPAYATPAPLAIVSAVTPPSHGSSTHGGAQPRDVVERALAGSRPPLLALAVALAALLSLLALSARRASGYRSIGARGSSPRASGTS